MKPLYVILSIATTALCWGVYGPVLHWGQAAMGSGRLRPFMSVGIAYFAIAIVVPMLMIHFLGSESDPKFAWTTTGTIWSLAGGAAGALGALGIIMAFNYGGKPIYVMPLVFGCAPVVNTIWTSYWNKSWHEINPFFAAGLILVAVGAVAVLVFQPKAPAGGHSGRPSTPPTPAAVSTPAPSTTAAPAAAKDAPATADSESKSRTAAGATPSEPPDANESSTASSDSN